MSILAQIRNGCERETADAYVTSLDDAGQDALHNDFIESLHGSDLTSHLQSGWTHERLGEWMEEQWTAFVAKRAEREAQ